MKTTSYQPARFRDKWRPGTLGDHLVRGTTASWIITVALRLRESAAAQQVGKTPPIRWLPLRSAQVYRFFAGAPFWATAAFTSALNAPASTCSPSWMSIALRVLPSKLELKRRDGSWIVAPRANVSFTMLLYVSPVQISPL